MKQSLDVAYIKSMILPFTLFTTLLIALGQIFFKSAANFNGPIYYNYFVLVALFFFLLAGSLTLVALKYGQLSIVYPILSTSYIWVTLFSYHLFKEQITNTTFFGVFLILCGITLIGLGGRR
ncbi:MAG: EamA family transporter [Candidatus Woesearchaeota archaeon]|nr:MAG: EamA family transporter [Candidatus Woesearchaeota archaeon]